ncbi:MAG TPA: T9SS type A sorting domain-containing protein [bacterium]
MGLFDRISRNQKKAIKQPHSLWFLCFVTSLSLCIIPNLLYARDSLNVRWAGGWPVGCADNVELGVINNHKYCFLTSGASIIIMNIDNAQNPCEIARINGQNDRPKSFFSNNYLYVASEERLMIYDVSNPQSPQFTGDYWGTYAVWGVWVKNRYAYVIDGPILRIVDVANPTAPYQVNSCSTATTSYFNCLAGKDDYIYCTGFGGTMYVINVQNPEQPFVCYELIVGQCFSITIYGNYLYIPNYFNDLTDIYDISLSWLPTHVGHILEGVGASVAVNGNYLYRTFANPALYRIYLGVYDISNPASPVRTDSVLLPGYGYYYSSAGIAGKGGYVYMAQVLGGFRIFDVYDPQDVYEISHYQTSGCNGSLFVKGNYAYLGEYSGIQKFLSIVDVSDPQNCAEIGRLAFNTDIRHIWVQGNYAYVTDDSGAMHIVDVSAPANPIRVGYYLFPSYWGARGIFVKDTFAYVSFFDPQVGIRVINVSDPTNPYEIGFCDSTESSYKIIGCDNYLYVSGYSYYHGAQLWIININDPHMPFICSYEGACDGNLWLSNDRVYIASWNDSLYIVDVSNPADPHLIGYYPYNADDVFSEDNLVYLSRSGYQLARVIDCSDPYNPTETGHYFCPTMEGVYWALRLFYANGYIYVSQWHLGLHIYKYYGVSVEETQSISVIPNLAVKNTKAFFEFTYCLSKDSPVEISVIDVAGRVVSKRQFNRSKGSHSERIHKESLASGVYFLQVESLDWKSAFKFVVIK